MPVSISRVTSESDLTPIAIIEILAMAKHPYHSRIFPHANRPPTLDGQIAQGLVGMKKQYRSGACLFLKATLDDSEEIVGFASWTVINPGLAPATETFEEFKSEKDDDYNGIDPYQGFDMEFGVKLMGIANQNAAEAMGLENKWIYLTLITVHPSHQGKGIGQALLSHGAEWVDNFVPPLRVYLQAHTGATRVYEKMGYKVVVEAELEDEKSEGGKISWVGMRRDAKA